MPLHWASLIRVKISDPWHQTGVCGWGNLITHLLHGHKDFAQTWFLPLIWFLHKNHLYSSSFQRCRNNSRYSKVFHHSPVGVFQLAGLLESNHAGQGLQDLLEGLQIHRQLLHIACNRVRNWKHVTCFFSSQHSMQTYLLANVLDYKLAELQSFHRLLLHHLALSMTNLSKTLERWW